MSNTITDQMIWFRACKTSDVPANGGVCIKYNNEQIAVFNFTRRGEWYACQNMCPHKMQMALSRGMIGSMHGEPKVACPFHKRSFSLVDGRCMADDNYRLTTYEVRVQDEYVYIGVEETTE